MKKIISAILLAQIAFANTLPSDFTCNRVEKSSVEKLFGTTFKYKKVQKLPINPSYDLSSCEFGNKVLADFTINYFGGTNSYSSVIPPFYKEQKVDGYGFDVKLGIDDGKVVEIAGKTKNGVLLFVFFKGIKDKSYTKFIDFMKSLRDKF